MDAVVVLSRSALAGDTAALAALASKVLGFAVVAGSSVLKLPQARPLDDAVCLHTLPRLSERARSCTEQILAILRAGNAKGLSRSTYEAEVWGYSLVLAYSLQRGLAFSAYGEIVFLLMQTFVLLAMLYHHSPPPT